MTHRRYEIDGYAMELFADTDGALVQITDVGTPPQVIRVPWPIMDQLCRTVSNWDMCSRILVTEVQGKSKAYRSFE